MTDTTTKRSRVGSVRQLPSGRWRAQVQRGYAMDGRRRVLSETCDTEAEARLAAQRLAAELGDTPSLARGVTLADVWAAYAATKGRRLAKKTMRGYSWYMERVWLPLLGTRDVSRISRRDVQEAMLTMGRDKADRSRRILSGVLTFAAERGAIERNPLVGARLELPGDTGERWADEDAFDADPFAAIEGTRDVWDARTVMDALPLMRGLPLESAWLAIVGGGLRVEEALAVRRMDVRRIEVAGREVTQIAVHHARTDLGERKRTKTARSVRIVAVVEPFGARLWELAQQVADPHGLVCPTAPSNQNHRWREYFMEPPTSKHCPKTGVYRGRLRSLPYLPLSRMRATHATLMQEAGVPDSLNAAAHGHSRAVAYEHYQRGDSSIAAERTGEYLSTVDNSCGSVQEPMGKSGD